MSLCILFNGVLVGASGYAMYCIQPQSSPYAFSACAFGLCHGLLGLLKSVKEEDADCCKKMREISTEIMEILPLPLINIQLFMQTEQSTVLALGHGLFIVPYACDLIAKYFVEEGEESNTDTLKHLTILGNVVSLLFLAVNEGNYLYGGMALTAFLTKYDSMFTEYLYEGTGEYCVLFWNSVFYILTSQALGASSE